MSIQMSLKRKISSGFKRRRVFDVTVLVCLLVGIVALAAGWWFGRSLISESGNDIVSEETVRAPVTEVRRGPVGNSVVLAASPALQGPMEWPQLLESTTLPADYAAEDRRTEEYWAAARERYRDAARALKDSPAESTSVKSSLAESPRESASRSTTRESDAGSLTDLDRLRGRRLTVPVEGVSRDELWDSFLDPRGSSRTHKAIDIMAPRGRPVVATEDGVIAKVFENRLGGKAIYQYGSKRRYTYYYAHLDRFADGLKAGDKVRRGQVIGFVGSTGNASDDAPHLHFAIYRMGPKGRWWRGEAINPYLVLTVPS